MHRCCSTSKMQSIQIWRNNTVILYYNAIWQCNATLNASVLLPPQCNTLQYIQMQLIYYDFENAECSGAATPQCNQYNTLHWNATNLLKHWMQRRCSTSTSTAKSISFSSPPSHLAPNATIFSMLQKPITKIISHQMQAYFQCFENANQSQKCKSIKMFKKLIKPKAPTKNGN